MALKLDTVRMLIADDVGVGKTIEAALIARELLDRGDAQGLCVLCPPHLCDQWQEELETKFHILAKVVRTSTLARLERDLPRRDRCFIFSTPRMRVSSFFACEYHMLNSFLYVKDNLLSFLKSFVPSALRNDSLIHLFLRNRASGKC